jgi:ethanolamine utilization microcompartment shell protein EutS
MRKIDFSALWLTLEHMIWQPGSDLPGKSGVQTSWQIILIMFWNGATCAPTVLPTDVRIYYRIAAPS